ncbi:MAG TPA: rhomboid family intramembrane serine protease [Spirochaetia bacterium]|nr:rhomboid family intramembrane serine protease [Spirochaetia bacterium]
MMKLRFAYNSPVILSFAIIASVVLLIDQISGGVFIRTFFTLYPDFSFASPLSWLRLFTYVIGHANWNHLISNFSFILLIGPVLEEKYGSLPILAMMLVTALATAALNLLLVHTGLYGASGIVFMLILLSSFTNIRQGAIPLTFILIVALYLVREFVNALTPSTVSQLAHIAGGVIGGVFGFVISRSEKTPALPAAGPGKKE